MQQQTLKKFSFIAVVLASACVLASCGKADAEPTVSEPQAQAQEKNEQVSESTGQEGQAVLSYDSTEYTVELQSCSLYNGEEALFQGLAYSDDGSEIGYFDADFGGLADSPHGEARIDFGATQQFESADEFIAMGTVSGHIVVTDSSDTQLIIMGGAWDQDGNTLGTATLRVSC